ncbi:membrane protease subunit (stomatin/prohibitin family) [Paenibacillus cellulosilyticus]|uniref:Membrane protease subunit (Stomatin/prohibitin family) n=1 Tax=Paenibacillus cellulosilyticus TaxID=375489 RepID=A0A2V2YSV5_9BACL|nr:SPFH domain-containing protein [Paenibacillus cellulosilyticus]PWV98689.1 membrane protease subunit (stomatin/prohibitin family) [Paenibacillus cellulosilyticus]QKS43808.1 SPFH domain-containing protein [Paenibacillus cellulosilyticus]
MGLFSFLRGQFVEVIEWVEDTESLVYRFPAYDNAIKMGAQLTVREGQAAIFLNEGTIADVFAPGRYELSTQNMPILTALRSWKHGFNSPFKADIYFVKTTMITDQKWGTTNPVIMRDKEFGIVRARGFGNYSFKVKDPAAFMKGILGSHESFNAEQIGGFFRTMIVSAVSDLMAESAIPIIDLAMHYDELSAQTADKLRLQFDAIGLALMGFVIENISLPDEVEKMIDKRSSMNIVGNLDQYMKFQTAESIRDAANNPGGGLAGAGAGLGAGMAMGQMINQMMNGTAQQQQQPVNGAAGAQQTGQQQQPQAQPRSTQNDETTCGNCSNMLSANDKFCPECGTARPVRKFCSECGGELQPGAKFCSSCGTKA